MLMNGMICQPDRSCLKFSPPCHMLYLSFHVLFNLLGLILHSSVCLMPLPLKELSVCLCLSTHPPTIHPSSIRPMYGSVFMGIMCTQGWTDGLSAPGTGVIVCEQPDLATEIRTCVLCRSSMHPKLLSHLSSTPIPLRCHSDS